MEDLPGKKIDHGGFTTETCWIFLGMEDFPGEVVDLPALRRDIAEHVLWSFGP